MPRASHDDAVETKCPNDKPHKCPPSSVCYGRFEYCSTASKSAEPCVNEALLETRESRLKMCQDIVKGQDVPVRHKSCDLEAHCRAEFKTIAPSSAAITQNDVDSWKYILPSCLCAALVVLAISVFLIQHFRKKAKRKKHQKEQARMLVNNDDNSMVAITINNRINENRLENGNTRQQSPDHDTENTELMAHIRGDLAETGNTQNSPDSGITPDSTAIPIHTNSSSGSVSNRNSNHSSDSSSASFDSVPQEENQRRPSPGDLHYDGHPADRENRQQRGVHMPSSEPSGRTQLVTNHTSYHHSNDGDLE